MRRLIWSLCLGGVVGLPGVSLALEDGIYEVGKVPSWRGEMIVQGDRMDIHMVAPSSGCTAAFTGIITRSSDGATWTATSTSDYDGDRICTLQGDRQSYGGISDGCISFAGVRCSLNGDFLSGPTALQGLAQDADQASPNTRSNHAPRAHDWAEQIEVYFATHYNSQIALRKAQALLVAAGFANFTPDGQWGPQTEAAFQRVADTVITIGLTEYPPLEPKPVADVVIGWMLALISADVLNTELPD